MLARIAAMARSLSTSPYVTFTPLLLAASACSLLIMGGGCSFFDSNEDLGSDPPARATVSQSEAAIKPGDRVTREITVSPTSTTSGSPSSVIWHPAEGASGFSFNPPPDNPAGPPPFTWRNISASAASTISVGYDAPPQVGERKAVVDSFSVQTGTAYTSRMAMNFYASAGTPTESGSASLAGSGGRVNPQVEKSPERVSAGYPLWNLQGWFVDSKRPYDSAACQSDIGLMQSASSFLAVRFPVLAPDTALNYGSPVRVRTGATPILSVLDYRKAGGKAAYTLPVVPAPQWVSTVVNAWPTKAGTAWMTFQGQSSPSVPCPADLPIPEGQWEYSFKAELDYGPTAKACADCVLESFVCQSGAASTPVPPSAQSLVAHLMRTHLAPGITCYGPFPFRLTPKTGASPGFSFVGGGMTRVQPPVQVAFQHELQSLTGATESVALSFSSKRGLGWRLYRGDSQKPNLTMPIAAPISVRSLSFVWLVLDVPASFTGDDTATVTATSAGDSTKSSYATSVITTGQAGGGTGAYTYWVPVVSRAKGANESQWRSDIGLLNSSESAATVELKLHGAAGTVSSRSITAAARGQEIVQDVVGSLPAPESTGAAGAANTSEGSGALEVVSTQPLRVSSRTYNLVGTAAPCYPTGTFGQNYSAYVPSEGLKAGEVAYLTQLTENAAYRTNIGLTNMGSTAATTTVFLLDAINRDLGSYQVTLNPGEWRQENRPFSTKAGQTNMERGFARVQVSSGDGVIAYASVVDNRTNDPTTMPMVRAVGGTGTELWIPVASHASGANQSQWRTDLGVLNRYMFANTITVRFYSGGGSQSSSAQIASGEQAIFADVVGQIPASGSGALQVTSDQPIIVSSRTYNQLAETATCYPGGTFGQNYDAITSTAALKQNDTAFLTQLVETADYRTNLAVTNTGSAPAVAAIALYDGAGQQLASYQVNLGAFEWKQENRPFFSKAGQTNLQRGYAKVTVSSGSGIIAYASVIDNKTNDPTTMPMLR